LRQVLFFIIFSNVVLLFSINQSINQSINDPFLDTKNTDSLYVRLPESIYTTTKSRYSIYYNNVLLTQTPEKYTYNVVSSIGFTDSMRYNLDSLPEGNYGLELQVKDSLGNILESKSTQIIVTDNNLNFPDTLKILFIGNSLTYAGKYERYCKEFLESTGNVVKLLGTQHYTVQDSIDGIFHEGRGGWTWYRYCTDNTTPSPFVFGSYPGVNIQRYIDESLNGEKPDIVTIFLGINDLYNVRTTSLELIDSDINNVIFAPWAMGLLIDKFQEALPNTPIGIVLIPPANEREETWYSVVGDSALCFEYKKKQHRLEQRYIDKYKELSKPNFSMIPVYPNIDTYLGYPSNDLQHPNLYGYEQLANSFYGWIKYQISEWFTEPKDVQIEYFDNSTILSWTAVNGASGYKIYRSTNPYEGFVEIDTCLTPGYTDTILNGSTKYFYKVTAEY